eukprot:TRINITY_DN62289_c0_g1_i1.p1 TRINITY_DN62289_c0_g1~~TRINITY_DN62289_c0_g1_i1.p1  ORF type:complete len:647 (+),score=306.30 TRINITY_DN62289_c0_g1_i1:196-2136(+)
MELADEVPIRERVNSVAIHPFHPFVALGLDTSVIKVWSLREKKCIAVLPRVGSVRVVAFSSDGHFLASAHMASENLVRGTGAACNVVNLWSVDSMGDTVKFRWVMDSSEAMEPGEITSISFCPSTVQLTQYASTQTNLLAIAADSQVLLWDFAKKDAWMLRAGNKLDGALVTSVSFSDDGQLLAVGVQDVAGREGDSAMLVWQVMHKPMTDQFHRQTDAERSNFLLAFETEDIIETLHFFPSAANAAAQRREATGKDKDKRGGDSDSEDEDDGKEGKQGEEEAAEEEEEGNDDDDDNNNGVRTRTRPRSMNSAGAPRGRRRASTALMSNMMPDKAMEEYRVAVGGIRFLQVLKIRHRMLDFGDNVGDQDVTTARTSKKRRDSVSNQPYSCTVSATTEQAPIIQSLAVSPSGEYLVTGDLVIDPSGRTPNEHTVTLWAVIGDGLSSSHVGKHDAEVRAVAFPSAQVSRRLPALKKEESYIVSASRDESVRLFKWNAHLGQLLSNGDVLEHPLTSHQEDLFAQSSQQLRRLQRINERHRRKHGDVGIRKPESKRRWRQKRGANGKKQQAIDHAHGGVGVAAPTVALNNVVAAATATAPPANNHITTRRTDSKILSTFVKFAKNSEHTTHNNRDKSVRAQCRRACTLFD